jgi:hypothetical protein
MNGQPEKHKARKADIFQLFVSLLMLGALIAIVAFAVMDHQMVTHIDDKLRERTVYLSISDLDADVRDRILTNQRADMVDWLTTHTQNREVTERIISAVYNSNIPVLIYFALLAEESGYNPNARGINANGSLDIGIGQLNNFVYSSVSMEILFDLGFNLKKSVEQLATNYIYTYNWELAIIIYNCGNLISVPKTTLEYMCRVMRKYDRLAVEYAYEFLD